MPHPGQADFAATVTATWDKLTEAGFNIQGTHKPYPGTEIIAFTSKQLKKAARSSERGGYGAIMRVSVTDNGGNIEVAYTNPKYWANAYRLNDNLDAVSAKLAISAGAQEAVQLRR